jgi:N-6 DNA Methylase
MVAKRKAKAREAHLAFEALSIEGGLLSPEWLSKVAQLQAGTQAEADYRILRGLNLRDEIGRYWRIAQAHWAEFKAGREAKVDPIATSERFVLALLRDVFGFLALAPVPAAVLQERAYPIRYATLGGRVPIVVAPADDGLDTLLSMFGDGTRRRSAFGLAQEYLNAQEQSLWGIACDGVVLRIVRDNASLTRPAWIEADLERIFTEDRYADFAALWLLSHETRFGREGQAVTECALEAWRSAGREQGTRARESLRLGVKEALVALGQGFLSHAESAALRADLHSGTLPAKDLFNQLLRLVYRLIFLLTVEERALLHPDGTSEATKELYASGYSIRHLALRSVKRSTHDRFADLWDATKIVCGGLAAGEPRLGLPALGGIFSPNQCPALDGAKIENRALLLAVFKLAWLREDGGLARVNWRDMGPEELGSVYESLLELVPQVGKDGREFGFATGGESKGNARKTTGSYYTPDSLVQVLLDIALEPVVVETLAKNPGAAVESLLRLSIVDPACGSGHFLLAAGRRLAAHVARLQANGTPSAAEYRHALRQVIGRCIFGVDSNPMAVELCKVSLWMEAVEPGLPLTFLNSHIQHGNSLLGATPEVMANGVPDDAWDPIEGDDKKTASALKKRNKKAAEGQRSFESLWSKPVDSEAQAVARAVAALDAASDTNVIALADKEGRWEAILDSPEYCHQKFAADAWCAAFVWPKQPGGLTDAAPTNELWRQLRDGLGKAPTLTASTVGALARDYHFFHWHLQFPQIFARGGFDVVLGNPPWDELSPDQREFFAKYRPDMRSLSREEQDHVVASLLVDQSIAHAWSERLRSLYTTLHFLKKSGRFTLYAAGNLGKGDFNVYRMFVELALRSVRPGGYAAQLAPAALYGGANASAIRKHLFDNCRLLLLLGCENAKRSFFPDVHPQTWFALYVASSAGRTSRFRVAFGCDHPSKVRSSVDGAFDLDADIVRKSSSETYAVPDTRNASDVEISAQMERRQPPFSAGWPFRHYQAELHMTNDSALFTTDLGGIPVYEGRMVTHFDHRAKTYVSGHGNSALWRGSPFGDGQKAIVPQWRILRASVPTKLSDRVDRYRIGFGDVANPRNERSFMAALIPPGTICGNTVPTIDFGWDNEWMYLPWLAVANSFAIDALARKKLSSPHIKPYILDTLPFPRPSLDEEWAREVSSLSLRLTCTSPEMTPYWNRMAERGLCEAVPEGEIPGSAIFDEEPRAVARARIDAVIARVVYGLTPSQISEILETFPVLKRRDEKAFGDYRTKRLILASYEDQAWPSVANVIPLPVRPASKHQLPITSAVNIPDLAAVVANAYTRPHTMERGEIQTAILAVLKANEAPMDRRQARLASLFCLEPHLLMPMIDKTEKAQWARVVGDDARKVPSASIDSTSQEWGAALTGLRGRERLIESHQGDTWALGTGAGAIDTKGWPDGRANFVVNLLRRLQKATPAEAIVLKLPPVVQQWFANAA